jgi:uncharacterized protein YukE
MTDVGILGADAVRGDPDAMGTVAWFLRSTADELHSVRATLERDRFSGVWEGAAADAFRELLHNTPEDLDKAARSYELAADTVGRYAGQLRSAHDVAQHLAARLAELMAQAGQADGGSRTARQAVEVARRAVSHATDPIARLSAERMLDERLRALAGADGHRNAIYGQIDAIRRQAADNRRALDAASQVTGDQLAEASRAGMRNSVGSWFERNGAVLGTVAHVALEGLKIAAHTLVDAYRVIDALRAYIKDPSWANLSEVLSHLGSALTVVTFVLTAALVIATGGAALALVPEIYAGLKIGTAAIDATKLGVDAWRMHLGDETVTDVDLGVDALSVFSDVAGLKVLDHKTSGWIHGMQSVKSTKWKLWAATCVVVGDSKPLSWRALERRLPEQLGVKDGIKEQVIDLVNDYTPVLGRPDDDRPRQRLLHSPVTEIKHRLTVPRINVPAAAQPAGGGAAW